MDKNSFGLGGVLFVLGLVALSQGSLQGMLLLGGLGIVFMAIGLGTDACRDVFDDFKSFFEDLINTL